MPSLFFCTRRLIAALADRTSNPAQALKTWRQSIPSSLSLQLLGSFALLGHPKLEPWVDVQTQPGLNGGRSWAGLGCDKAGRGRGRVAGGVRHFKQCQAAHETKRLHEQDESKFDLSQLLATRSVSGENTSPSRRPAHVALGGSHAVDRPEDLHCGGSCLRSLQVRLQLARAWAGLVVLYHSRPSGWSSVSSIRPSRCLRFSPSCLLRVGLGFFRAM